MVPEFTLLLVLLTVDTDVFVDVLVFTLLLFTVEVLVEVELVSTNVLLS